MVGVPVQWRRTHSVRQTPMAVDDWLVADSEEEDAFPPLFSIVRSRPSPSRNLASETSAIQTAVFTPDQPRTPQRSRFSPSLLEDDSLFTPPQLPRVRTDSTIGNFTSMPSTSGPPSVLAPKPRPKPRMVMRKTAPSSPRHSDVTGTSFSHISDPPIAATRTNDSIYSPTATSIGFPEVIEDAYSSFGIAERAKLRSRKSQKAKKRIEPPVAINDVIELTSDEDELALKPPKRQKKQGNPPSEPKVATRPRPKPTPWVKPAPVLPSGSPSNGTAVEDASAPQRASSPRLPESTLPTVPPSTPPQDREPTPFFSPLITTIRKRKRIRPSIPDDEDEMDGTGGLPTGDSSSNSIPPPFFAASSSSLPTDSGVEIPREPAGRGKRKQASSSKKTTQTKTQNKGKRGKKIITATDEVVEESARINQESHSSVLPDIPSFADEHHSPEARQEKQLSDDLSPPRRDAPLEHTPATRLQVRSTSIKPKLTPMTELIRRVNSQPCSPFPNAARTYSPFIKSSRTMLSRIAPLHPNRRTPPPPPPRPPPPKKSKKQLEMEERIEEELSETVEGWSCLTDEERRNLRKTRIDAELGYE